MKGTWAGFQHPMPWDSEWDDCYLTEQEFWIMFARSHGSLVALRCFERRNTPVVVEDEDSEDGFTEIRQFDPQIIFGELYAEMLGLWMLADGEDDVYRVRAHQAELDHMQADAEAEMAQLFRARLLAGVGPKPLPGTTTTPLLCAVQHRERSLRWLYCNARRMWPMPEDYENIPAFVARHYSRQAGT